LFSVLAYTFDVEVVNELVDEEPEFLMVHGGIMSISGSIVSSMVLNPVNVGSSESSVGDFSPVSDGTIKLWWSELVVVIGVNSVEDSI